MNPKEGGLTFVVDVASTDAQAAISHLHAAGFVSRDYYAETPEVGVGGPDSANVRLRVDATLSSFTDAEERRIDADFRRSLNTAPFEYVEVAVERWEAGDDSAWIPPTDGASGPMGIEN